VNTKPFFFFEIEQGANFFARAGMLVCGVSAGASLPSCLRQGAAQLVLASQSD